MTGAARSLPWRWFAGPVMPLGPIGAIGLAIACSHGSPAIPANTAREGLSIALYDSHDGGAYSVIDDRRWIEVAGDSLVIDRVDPGAVLSSLVIEPLAGGALAVGACLRDRIPASPSVALDVVSPAPASAGELFAPVLRCAVHARSGRYLVRLLYVSPALGYRAQHDITMTAPDRAIVASRFAIVTPAWQAHAEVTLFDGIPGSEQPPREVARGAIMLDGGTSVIAVPPREVTAQLRRVYNGAVPDNDDDAPRHDAQPAVWVWLELDEPALALGPVRAHVELAGEATRDIDVPAAGRRRQAVALRLPLWIDDQLRGTRDHRSASFGDVTEADRFAVSVSNTGDAAREVWIEEKLRPVRRRTVTHAWPSEPVVVKDLLRMKLTVHGGKIERAGFEITYEP